MTFYIQVNDKAMAEPEGRHTKPEERPRINLKEESKFILRQVGVVRLGEGKGSLQGP